MKGLSVSFALVFLLFTRVSVAQVSITFSNKDIGYCIDCGWVDPGVKSGVQPTAAGYGSHGYYGGWWDIADQSKKNCINRDSSSAGFGKVSLCCLGIGTQDVSGNFLPWRLTYFYKDTGGVVTKDSISVTIYPLPVVSAGPDKSICQNNNPFQIYPYPNTGVGSGWLSPPSPVPNMSGSPLSYDSVSRNHFFNPQKATEDTFYSLVYITTKQYPKARCQNADTAMVYIRPIPKVDAGRLSDVCEDAPSVDLQTKSGAKVFPSLLNGTRKWKGLGVDTINSIFNPGGSGVFYPFPNVLQFCFTNDTGCTACDTTTIVVHKLPVATLVDVPDMCETHGMFILKGNHPQGENSKFNLNAVMCNDTLFSWPDSLPGFPTQYGENYVTYTFIDSFGCQKTVADSFYIYPRPIVHIIGQNPYYNGQAFSLKADIKKGAAFQWSRSGDGVFTFGVPQQQGATSTDSVVGYLPGATELADKKFIVRLTSTNNGICPASVDSFVVGIWVTSIDKTGQNGLRVYPNPTSGKLIVEGRESVFTCRVLNNTGREVYDTRANQSIAEIDFSKLGLKKGLYFIKVEGVENNRTIKVLYQ